MNKKSNNKLCRVCGDRSTGKNFGVYSCESCKAFFRRNAFKFDEYNCHFNGECDINSATRKFCRKCRLEKCLAVGMKKEWILNETEREIRQTKINENRIRRNNGQNETKKGNNERNDDLGTNGEVMTTSEDITSDCNSMSNCDQSIDMFDLFDETLFISQDSLNDMNQVSNETIETIADYDLSVVPVDRPLTDYSNNLNEVEGLRISEVLNATKELRQSVATNGLFSNITEFREAINSILLVADQEVRKLVNTSKSLKAFRGICEDDRISLLKIGCLEMLLLRTAVNYDRSTNCWYYSTSNRNISICMDLMKQGPRNCYEDHKKFHTKFPQFWDEDPIILDLLTVILLFNPDRPGLKHKDLVKLEQYIYKHLLKRYLQLKYRSEGEANTRLMNLFDNFQTIHILSKKHALNFYEDTVGQDSEPDVPLLREICDVTPFANELDTNQAMFAKSD